MFAPGSGAPSRLVCVFAVFLSLALFRTFLLLYFSRLVTMGMLGWKLVRHFCWNLCVGHFYLKLWPGTWRDSFLGQYDRAICQTHMRTLCGTLRWKAALDTSVTHLYRTLLSEALAKLLVGRYVGSFRRTRNRQLFLDEVADNSCRLEKSSDA